MQSGSVDRLVTDGLVTDGRKSSASSAHRLPQSVQSVPNAHSGYHGGGDGGGGGRWVMQQPMISCLLYTSDAADDM
eukprot:5860360-Prymnesium_polylepis.1